MKNEIIEKYLECLITNKRILKLILIIFYNYYNYSFPIVANVYKNTHFSIHNGNYICYPNISFGTSSLNFFELFSIVRENTIFSYEKKNMIESKMLLIPHYARRNHIIYYSFSYDHI